MSLRFKIFVSLFLLGAASAIMVGGFAYVSIGDVLRHNALAQLEAVATAKQDAVRLVCEGWIDEAHQIASRTRLRTALRDYNAAPNSADRKIIARIITDSGSASEDLIRIRVMDNNGYVVTQYENPDAPSTQLLRDSVLPIEVGSADRNNSLGRPEFVGIGKLDNHMPAVEIRSRLLWNGSPVGEVLLLRSAKAFAEITHDFTGLGQSGETIMAKRMNNADALFLTALRHDANSAFRRVVLAERKDVPTVAAVQGEEFAAYSSYVDYRDVPVLSVSRYLPDIDAGLVTKIDRDEAEAAIIRLRNLILMTILAVLIFSALTALLLSRALVEPISRLATAVSAISGGNFSTRVKTGNRDELGRLGADINAMAAHLGETSTRIAESEERFRRAFHDAAIGMALVSLEGKWLQVNEALCEMLGYSETDLLATDFQTITHPADLTRDLELVNELLAGKIEKYTMSKRYIHQRGDLVHVRLNVSLVRDHDDRPLHFVSQIEDVSNEVRMRIELQDTVEQLQQSINELQDFAYTASHDLKEPLRTITNFSRFIDEDYRDRIDHEGQQMLRMMREAAQWLEGLIDELLHYSRAGQSELDLQPVDLNEIVESIANDLQAAFADKTVSLKVAPNLPQIVADRVRVKQILQNLIANAIKYNDNAEPLVEVGFRDENPPVFFVKDNGIGIPEVHHEKIFRIFKRLHGKGEYGGGFGAGLTIVKKLIEKHNGRIWLDPDSDQGARFCFTLSKSKD